jgi:hypothetical protein
VASASSEFDHIDVTVNFDAVADPLTQKVFTIRKFKFDGSVDDQARSHVFTNIKVSGRVRGWQHGVGAACIDVFSTTSGEVWTGDFAANFQLCDLYLTGDVSKTGINVNYQPFAANTGVSLERVYSDMVFGRVNMNEQHSFDARQVSMAGLVCGGYTAYTPTITGSSSNPTLGNGSVVGRWRREGDWVDGYVEFTIGSTTSGGSGNIRFSLPTLAAVGEGDQVAGGVLVQDSGTRFYAGVPLIASNVQYVEMYVDQAVVSFTSPFSYATNDKYRVSFRYLTAA